MYAQIKNSIAAPTQIITTALGIFFSGSIVSSEYVVTESKPTNTIAIIAAPVISVFIWNVSGL